MLLPMPEVPPMTTATRPVRSVKFFAIFCLMICPIICLMICLMIVKQPRYQTAGCAAKAA
jgi:hypothetical protein